MTTNGLQRLIMIASGVSDYVEIVPQKSTHLVADNNIGKTSILSTLQFLLIDDWTHMDFPKNRPETEEFYFASRKSFIIFEINDVEGTNHLVIFRGNGLASNKRYTRWLMAGHYDESIFISRNEEGELVPHDWEEVIVNATNQGRSLTEFKNSTDLKRKLRMNPRWLPTKEGTAHQNFITVLKTLNTLGEVKEKKLKQVLLDINESLELSMDFSKEFGVQWYDYQDRKLSHLEISKHSDSITKAKEAVEQKSQLEVEIIGRLEHLGPSVEALSTKAASQRQILESKYTEESNRFSELKTELDRLEKDSENLNVEMGQKDEQIRSFESIEKWADGKNLDDLQAQSSKAEDDYFDLKKRKENTKLEDYESSEQIGKRIDSLSEKADRLRNAIEDKQTTLLGQFQKLEHHTPNDPWRVLNPQMLLSQGSIVDRNLAIKLFSDISGAIKNSKLEYEGLSVDSITEVKGIDQFDDPTEMENEYRLTEKQLNEAHIRFKDIENYEALIEQLGAAEQTFRTRRKDVEKLESWIAQGVTELEKCRQELIKIHNRKAELKEELRKSQEKVSDSRSKLEEIRESLNSIGDRNNRIVAEWSDLQRKFIPNLAFNAVGELAISSVEEELFKIRQLERQYDSSSKVVSDIQIQLFSLSSHIKNPNVESFFPMLFERLQSIELEKENLGKEWINIATNMSSKANNLRQSLNKLRQEVHDINKLFRQTNVSNLEEFSVEFIEHSNDVSLIQNISKLTAFSAWTQEEDEVAAMRSLGDAMTSRSAINIGDLFHLRYKVQNKGTEKPLIIDSLDDSGSTGTVTIIKAVLLMILLKKTLNFKGRNRIALPIYIDEVGVLGPRNYSQIIEISSSLGFQIFTASPKSVETADVVYPLLGGRERDRLFLTPDYARPRPTASGEEE